MQTLDLELLRTLSVVQETGTLARASRRVGRTLSAVSLQLKRLEAQCGRPLFRKAGRRLELNAEGEQVLAAGRRMLALNDQLLESLRSEEAEAHLRLGVPQDIAERWLPEALARFSRAHPRVQLEVRVETNLALRQLLADGGLDLAVTFDRIDGPLPSAVRLPVRWLAHPDFRWDPSTPLPLVLFEPPCTFRRMALEALDRAGLPWRVSFSSPSLSGLWAAVSAGLGVTVRTELATPSRVVPLQSAQLPALPPLAFGVEVAAEPPSRTADELRGVLAELLARAAAGVSPAPRGSRRPAPPRPRRRPRLPGRSGER
ncbi:MAG TPA: LysR substrate-binding domain-containing protein [Myxococcaceae bacterium]|nr:LysR substrate-binding domain-containing protein [Myxococcaceae bacterium]